MKQKCRVYSFELFKKKLGIEGDVYLIEITPVGIKVYTFNEGADLPEGALPYPERAK